MVGTRKTSKKKATSVEEHSTPEETGTKKTSKKKASDDNSTSEEISTRKTSKKKAEEIAKNVQTTPDSVSMPPAKRLRSKSCRKVQFDANPQVLEITPLVEKPAGLVRMPEQSKVFDDLSSPTPDTDELIEIFLDDSIINGEIVKNEGTNNEGNNNEGNNELDNNEDTQHSIEIIDPSQTFTIPPVTKIQQTKTINELHHVPQFHLDEDELPQQSTEDNEAHENSLPLLDKHVLDDYEYFAYQRGKAKSSSSKRYLWSHLFMPKRQEEFIGKSKADYLEFKTWLEKWCKQINLEKEKNDKENNKKKNKKDEEINKRKKRRNPGFEEELMDDYEEENEEVNDEDNDFELLVFDEHLFNPAILSGPTGCGKSVMVYQAAKECKFDVIEISSTVQRDGQSLKQKISGALENHNVQSRKQSDIRSIFGNNNQIDNSNNKKKNNEFSLLLIDECDLIYESDSNFWPTLRQICMDSRIPIILTCNDLEYVLKEVGKDVGKDDLFVIQMERPTDRLFTQYLRNWYFGFTNHYHKTCSFFNLITIKNKDPRAVLNSLHFGLDMDISNDYSRRRSNSIERETNYSLSEFKKRADLLSTLDASFGPSLKNISILTKCSSDLDFNNGDLILNNFCNQIEEQYEMKNELLKLFDMDQSDLLLRQIEYREIIKMFCLNSSNKFYTIREACIYYLPCLLSIHQSWCTKINLIKQRLRQNEGNNLFNSSPRRFPPHPFDIVDTNTGQMLNQNLSLSSFIEQFQFAL